MMPNSANPHAQPIQFFDKLGHLFNHRKGSDHGAIYLIQKRRKTRTKFLPKAFPRLSWGKKS